MLRSGTLGKPEFANISTVPSPVNAMGIPLFMHLNKMALGSTAGNYEPAVKKYKETEGIFVL